MIKTPKVPGENFFDVDIKNVIVFNSLTELKQY